MTKGRLKATKRSFAVFLSLALAAQFTIPAIPAYAEEPGAEIEIPEQIKDQGYTLVWNDEFNGTTLNTDDWNVELHEPGWVNAEWQRYTKLEEGNIAVDDGALKIYPKAEKVEGADTPASSSILKGKGFNKDGWSGGAGGDGAGSVAYEDGKAIVTIENAGTDTWHMQLQQSGLSVKLGHEYEFKVKAKSNVERNVLINVLDPARNYAWYGGGETYTLGEEEQEITFKFKVDGEGDEGKERIATDTLNLQFALGKLGDTAADTAAAVVTLSDVSIVDLDETVDSIDLETGYKYTSGRVNTQGKHDFTYGYFEAAARVPSGMGYLPAFWLMASDEDNYGQWPKCGEIDIMEVMGQDTTLSYHTIHYGYSVATHKENQVKNQLTTGDYNTEYHVYGLDWEPGKLTWYVDGEEIGSTDDCYTGKDEESKLAYPAPFDQEFYVILNLAIGGSWVKYPTQEVVDDMENQSYDIDYVRVYQKAPEVYAQLEEEAKAPVHVIEYRDPDENGNYVRNGNFAEALKPMDAEGDNFELHLESDCKTSTSEIIEGDANELKIVPSAEGGETYSVQLKQGGIPMYRGWEYELTFDAYADEARTIVVDVEGPDNGWTRYMKDTTVELTNEKKTYTYTFTMDEKTDANGCLEFNLGKQDSTAPVYLSNISLKYKSGEEIEEVFEKKVTADGNYIYNGSFDQGDGRLGYWEVAEDDLANVSVTNTLLDGERTRELRAKVEVLEGASEANPVVVKQSELAPIAKGVYEFSFDAYTTDGAADGMKAIIAGEEIVPNLKATKETFEFSFDNTKNLDRSASNVVFEFTKPGTYYLDNVALREAAMIKNGSFNSGLSGYEYGAYAPGVATFGVDSQKEGNDTAFDADIKDSGTADWNIQLKQPGVVLEKGKWYKLTYKAKATVDRKISVVFQRDGSKDDLWTVYSGDNQNDLVSTWQDFELVFQMNDDTDTNALLSVSMGTFGDRITDVHHVYLDDFALVETEKPVDTVSIADAKVDLSAATFTYNGQVQKPSVKAVTVDGEKLVSDTDYTVEWKDANSKNAGKYTVTITGQGNYTGTVTATYEIKAKQIAPAISLSKSAFSFNGKVQKPTVTVKDGATKLSASDCTVKYSNASSKKVGTYKITVTLKGNYSGSKTVTYKINKAANPLKVKAKKATVSLAKLKKKDQKLKVSKVIKTSKKGKGTMVYSKAKGSSKIKVNSKTGAITVKKGLKKGTYTVVIKVKAKGNASYKASKTFKLKVKIVVK